LGKKKERARKYRNDNENVALDTGYLIEGSQAEEDIRSAVGVL